MRCACGVWLIGFVMLSCGERGGGTQAEAIDEEEDDFIDTLILVHDAPLPESVDELFGDFFFNFSTDARFAATRMRLPLLSRSNPEEEFISREQWEEQRPLEAPEFFCVIYEREGDMEVQNDTSLHEANVWRVYLQEQREECYYFNKVDGRWLLKDYDLIDWTQTPMGDFLGYLAELSADSLRATDFVRFPLHWVMVSDDGEEVIEEDLWEEDWEAFCSEVPMPEGVLMCIDYGQPVLSSNRKVLSMEGLSNGLYVKFKFDKVGGKWWMYEVEL